jgi:hypothetical protein
VGGCEATARWLQRFWGYCRGTENLRLRGRLQPLLWGAQTYALPLVGPRQALPPLSSKRRRTENQVLHGNHIGATLRSRSTAPAAALPSGPSDHSRDGEASGPRKSTRSSGLRSTGQTSQTDLARNPITQERPRDLPLASEATAADAAKTTKTRATSERDFIGKPPSCRMVGSPTA